jgi:hypothetical protein
MEARLEKFIIGIKGFTTQSKTTTSNKKVSNRVAEN